MTAEHIAPNPNVTLYTKAPTFRSLPECDNEIHVHQGGRSVVTRQFLKNVTCVHSRVLVYICCTSYLSPSNTHTYDAPAEQLHSIHHCFTETFISGTI